MIFEMIFKNFKYLPNIGLYDTANRHLHNRMDPHLYFGPSTFLPAPPPPKSHIHKNEFLNHKRNKERVTPNELKVGKGMKEKGGRRE
jgi:hypothetical protein